MTVPGPLVVDLIDLPRAAGATVHHDVEWVVPEGLGTSQMWVEPGITLQVSVDVTAINDGVVAHVSLPVDLQGECVRCLDPVTAHHQVRASDLYMEHSRLSVPADADEDGDHLWIEHDTVDLEPLLRDAIVTQVDDRPLCRPDCPGLCPVCGEKWDNLPPDHHHDQIDPRMATLATLLGEDLSTSASGSMEVSAPDQERR